MHFILFIVLILFLKFLIFFVNFLLTWFKYQKCAYERNNNVKQTQPSKTSGQLICNFFGKQFVFSVSGHGRFNVVRIHNAEGNKTEDKGPKSEPSANNSTANSFSVREIFEGIVKRHHINNSF